MSQWLAKWTRIAAQILLIAGFFDWIAIYSVKTFSHLAEKADKLPKCYPLRWSYWKEFPNTMQPLFEDNIRWKDIQVRRYARFKLDTLGVSPTPRVWVGEDGWLFLNHEAETENYFALTDPRLVDRRQQWVTALPEWHAWLKERGIRLQIVVPPNKQSIYSEYLPEVERKRIGPTPLDVLLEQLRQRDPTLPILDLREPVRAAKSQGQLYFKTDTHWNPRGLCVGYREMARALGFDPLPPAAIQVAAEGMKDGDLPKQMGYWRLGAEAFEHLKIVNPQARKVPLAADTKDETRLDYLDSRLYVNANEKLPKAVIFHDSFGDGIFSELLAEHCGRLMCIPSNHMDPAVIAREKPDIVVLEIVERLVPGHRRSPTDRSAAAVSQSLISTQKIDADDRRNDRENGRDFQHAAEITLAPLIQSHITRDGEQPGHDDGQAA